MQAQTQTHTQRQTHIQDSCLYRGKRLLVFGRIRERINEVLSFSLSVCNGHRGNYFTVKI